MTPKEKAREEYVKRNGTENGFQYQVSFYLDIALQEQAKEIIKIIDKKYSQHMMIVEIKKYLHNPATKRKEEK